MSDQPTETIMSAEQALDEIMGALHAENVAGAVQAAREMAGRKPLAWLDSQGAIQFAPMTYRAVQRLIGALESGMVVRP